MIGYTRFNLNTVDILGQIIFLLGVGGQDWKSSPVHCEIFSSIPGLHLLHSSSIPPSHDNQ